MLVSHTKHLISRVSYADAVPEKQFYEARKKQFSEALLFWENEETAILSRPMMDRGLRAVRPVGILLVLNFQGP